MASLLYLKHAYNLSEEERVERWAENAVWQYFSAQVYNEPKLPGDASEVGRIRSAIGEAGVEELLKATIDTTVASKGVRPAELEWAIFDTIVQEKAFGHLVDSRIQQPKNKNKLYALDVPQADLPEAQYIGKGKPRMPYEFGVKASGAITHRSALMVGARSVPGNHYDVHMVNAQLGQAAILLEDTGKAPRKALIYSFPFGQSLSNPLICKDVFFEILWTNGLIQRFPKQVNVDLGFLGAN